MISPEQIQWVNANILWVLLAVLFVFHWINHWIGKGLGKLGKMIFKKRGTPQVKQKEDLISQSNVADESEQGSATSLPTPVQPVETNTSATAGGYMKDGNKRT